ncbi:hypothetical protein N7495_006513 [Penicillium taxi]|uniref:uncharacterized protein n=1 Tax=Penicillium taxi TaxID=168475 RepID=UPI0025459F9F|nr:uncharacterized protein N7495_006513 [Penicillium taxi]KAJ5894822.1 hypothetical protein N7495_006513 [Penicillium taxi]
MPLPDEKSLEEERLKAELWRVVTDITDEETVKFGISTTPQFISALTELVWIQLETASIDIESFAKHAGRSKVNISDVMMLGRRNEGVNAILRAYIESRENNQEKEAS